MRRTLALIPAMTLALSAHAAMAQQQPQPGQPVGTGGQIERPGPVEDPRQRANQELEIQDSDTEELSAAGDVDIVPHSGAPAAQLNGRGPADVPAQDFAEEMQRQPANPPEPEDPLAHLNRTPPQPGQISQPADAGVSMEAQAGAAAASDAAGQPQPNAASQGRQDPVPLPDVPEAVAEELQQDNVEGVRVPQGVGQPPRTSGDNVPPREGQPAPTGQPQPQR